MTSSMIRRSIPLAIAAAAALAGSASAQPAVVDGDLTDLIGYAQQSQSDPPSDVTDVLVSGWDFTDVHVYYYPKADTLFLGLELQQNGAFPGCPGDADGDSNPNDTSRLDVPFDQFGVGEDEAYIFYIDTDLNGSHEDFADLTVLYRNNQLTLSRGDGSPVPAGVTGEIVLGTKGALLDPGMPNSNRDTEDIELAIRNYSYVDFNACEFSLSVFAGSLVDALKEDILDAPLLFMYPEEVVFRTDIIDGEGGVFDGVCWNVGEGTSHLVQATITNTGVNTLTPIWINFHIPNGAEYLNDSVDGAIQGRSLAIGDGTLHRFIRPGFDNTLSPGETETITIVVRVNSFATDPLIIRGYAEGVLSSDKRLCIFSCIGTICLTEDETGS